MSFLKTLGKVYRAVRREFDSDYDYQLFREEANKRTPREFHEDWLKGMLGVKDFNDKNLMLERARSNRNEGFRDSILNAIGELMPMHAAWFAKHIND